MSKVEIEEEYCMKMKKLIYCMSRLAILHSYFSIIVSHAARCPDCFKKLEEIFDHAVKCYEGER